MRQRSHVLRPESGFCRRRRPFAFGGRTLGHSRPRHGLALILIAALALTGCDLFDPAKTDDPVFPPAPPRKVTAANKGTFTQPTATQTAENTPGNTDSATIHPVETSGGAQQAAGTTRGTAPVDGTIKPVSYTRQLPPPSKKLAGTEVAAMVNGQPIFCSEIFERANPEPMTADGLSLLVAAKNPRSVSDREVRQMQEMAIRKYLKDYIKTRVLCQALVFKLEKEQKDKMEEAIKKMFDEYVDKLKKDLKVLTRAEVDTKLKQQGTSLAGLQVEFRYRLLADEYLRQKSKKPHVVGRQEILAYYQSHLSDYSYPERVHWQLLEISFAKHGGQPKALAVLEKVVDALHRGEDFGKVVKKYSDGARAENGGQQSWTKPDSVADAKTAALLHTLAPGEISGVIHTADSYRLIRLNQRKPAGRNSLAQVQDLIRQKIEDKLQKEAVREVLVDVYSHAVIESAFLSPEELGPPADVAGLPARAKSGSDSPKKRRDRS
jgi:parvulin-like peptidyl-prolyl isomerase